MKRTFVITLIAGALLMLAGLVFAGEKATDSNEQATVKTEGKAETKELKNQTHCPVMGGKIDSTAYTDIQGQRVYHCCPACTENLVANPDKYFKQAAADGIVFENIQETDPICGMELKNKDNMTMYEGRRLYFCSAGCVDKFNEEPVKYLSAMMPETEKTKDEKSHKHEHGADHDHDHGGGHDHDHDH